MSEQQPLPDVAALGPVPEHLRRKRAPKRRQGDDSGGSTGEAGGVAVCEAPAPRPGRGNRKGRGGIARFPRGRKTALTSRLASRICARVARGVPLNHAARASGIPESTVNQWYKRGCDEPNSEWEKFALQVDAARGIAVSRRVIRIDESGKSGNWQADKFWLETQTQEFAPRKQIEHTGQVNHAHIHAHVPVGNIDPSELANIGQVIGKLLQPAIETTASQ